LVDKVPLKARGGSRGVACVMVAALALSVTGGAAVGRVSGTLARASQARSGVFVEPLVSTDLWVTTLDPAAATDVTSNSVIQLIYAGLLKQAFDDKTKTFKLLPDLAEAMPRVSQGGKVYTFKIRKNARFSDGKLVTAQDAVYSVNRALSPAEASPVAGTYLGAILRAADVAAGKAKTVKGVRAIGPDMVEITLIRPAAYFLYALTYGTGAIVERTLPAGAKMTTTPALVVGAGPFMVKGAAWQYRKQITLVPNPYFYNARNITIKEFDLPFVGATDTAFKAYQGGQYPMVAVPAAQVSRYRGTPEFREAPLLSMAWLAMNVKLKPFNNLHVRRAVALAINRDGISQGVMRGAVNSLYSWYPVGIVGYDPGMATKAPHYDTAMARKELALALKDMGGKAPGGIMLEYPSDSADTGRQMLQVQADLKAIGITIGLRAKPGNAWLNDMLAAKAPFIFNNWLADYPDLQDFSEYLMGTGGGGNAQSYSNTRVDNLFARAAVEQAARTRASLYRLAQLTFLNDASVAMLYQPKAQFVISPRYHGVEIVPSEFLQPLNNDWANASVSP